MSQRPVFKSGLTLATIAAVCTTLVAATYQSTRDRIAANEKALLEQSLQPALAGLFYDSGVTESRVVIEPPHDLPGSDPVLIYRVFAEGEPVAALFVVTARDGFAGPIRVLVGVGVDHRGRERGAPGRVDQDPDENDQTDDNVPMGCSRSHDEALRPNRPPPPPEPSRSLPVECFARS